MVPVAQSEVGPITLEQKLGIVVSVDQQKGILTLAFRDGTCSHLSVDPTLLAELRIGGPVQALVEDTIVRTLRRL